MRSLMIGFLLFIGLGLAAVSPVKGAVNPLGLDDQNHYDIYIAGYGDVLSVIRSVDILAVKEFAGQTFMLIRTDTFNAKRSEGLISFASVRAILPSGRGSLDVIGTDLTATPRMKYYTPQGLPQ